VTRPTRLTAGWALTAVGGALELGGGAVAVSLVAAQPVQTRISPGAVAAFATAVVGAVTAIVGMTVAAVFGTGPSVNAAVETETTFLTYDASLRRRLALSDDDLLRAGRDAKPPARPAPPAPPAPPPPPTPPTAVPLVDDTPPMATLHVAALPARCPGESALRGGVGARLGRDPFVENHRDVIAVNAVEAVDGLVLTVELRSAGDLVGVRTLTGRRQACAELVSRAALAIAVLLDPLAPVVPQSAVAVPAVSEPTP
jgi:hypothetical protein